MKYPFGEMSVRRSIRSGKRPFGETASVKWVLAKWNVPLLPIAQSSSNIDRSEMINRRAALIVDHFDFFNFSNFSNLFDIFNFSNLFDMFNIIILLDKIVLLNIFLLFLRIDLFLLLILLNIFLLCIQKL